MSECTRVLFLLITFSIMTACTSIPRVQSSHDDSLDMSVYETYNFSSRTEIENPDLPDTLELLKLKTLIYPTHWSCISVQQSKNNCF